MDIVYHLFNGRHAGQDHHNSFKTCGKADCIAGIGAAVQIVKYSLCSIGQIYQTFGGMELYPSVEQKAAMLLYLVTKNHSFSDGNKRIAATLFLWFLLNNGVLYRADGSKRITDATLVTMTLMIAESRPEDMEMMVKIVVNLMG